METTNNLLINILPFTFPVKEQDFTFQTEQKEGFCPIHKGDLEGLIEDYFSKEELVQTEWLYSDFSLPKDGEVSIRVDLTKSVHFASHYYR